MFASILSVRHKYETRGIILARSPLGEASAFVTLLTNELGLVRARAQGVRRSGAKLAAALTTYAESRLILVRGREGWRVSGAVLETPWFERIRDAAARDAAARMSGLLVRLVAGETHDQRLFLITVRFFGALETLPEDARDVAEILAVLRILAVLGFDAGSIPGGGEVFSSEALAEVAKGRVDYVARINRGIVASGL